MVRLSLQLTLVNASGAALPAFEQNHVSKKSAQTHAENVASAIAGTEKGLVAIEGFETEGWVSATEVAAIIYSVIPVLE